MRIQLATIGTALAAGAALLAFGGSASAREADPCTGPSPVAGVEIRGPVLHVIDGETLCVALGYAPDTWIRLRLADAPPTTPVLKTSTAAAPPPLNPRGVLMQAALAKMATCRTVAAADGSVEALCEIEGRPLGQALRDPRVVEAGYSWR